MRKSLFLLMTAILLFPSLASAQSPPKLGNYELDWSIIHWPVFNEPPLLTYGSGTIVIEPATPESCPPEAVSMTGGPAGWCFLSNGGIYSYEPFPGVTGYWHQYPGGKAVIQNEPARGDVFTGVATFISPVKAFITYPRADTTVSGGTVWVVMWAQGTTGSANLFRLVADGKLIAVKNVGSSSGPVAIPWNTTGVAKGVHTLRVDVQDAEENTGSTTLTVVLQ